MFWGMKTNNFFPIYISTGGHEELNLLLISDEEKYLYFLIKSFNSLMRNHTKHHGTKEFCMRCLQAFSTKEVLAKHNENSTNHCEISVCYTGSNNLE